MARNIIIDISPSDALLDVVREVIDETFNYQSYPPEVNEAGTRNIPYILIDMTNQGYSEEELLFDVLADEFGDDVVYFA